MKTFIVLLLLSACSCGGLCEGSPPLGVRPAAACTSEYAGVEYCTGPASGTFLTCGGSCWQTAVDGPCFPPLVQDGGSVSCPSGQLWRGRTCEGVDAGTRSCFGRTQAECALGCWYPVGLCTATGAML